MTPMPIVIVESPFTHPFHSVDVCVLYAQYCVLDVLARGECPLASHLFLTHVLPEGKASRKRGLECRDRIARATGGIVAQYLNLGLTGGMIRDVDCTAKVEARYLSEDLLRRFERGEAIAGSLSLMSTARHMSLLEQIATLTADLAVARGVK